MTFTHLPGGDVSKCNWDWMFLNGVPGLQQHNYGLPSRVVVAYNPGNLDASTLECLEVIANKVPAQRVVVYGFRSGIDFGINRYGYFGMLGSKPTKYDSFSQNPNYFRHHLEGWLKEHR